MQYVHYNQLTSFDDHPGNNYQRWHSIQLPFGGYEMYVWKPVEAEMLITAGAQTVLNSE